MSSVISVVTFAATRTEQHAIPMRKSVSLAKVESMIDNAQVRNDDRKHGTK